VKKLFIAGMFAAGSLLVLFYRPAAQGNYIPQAVFCADGSAAPCSIIPAYIGPDPSLKGGFGYPGLFKPYPTSPAQDVQTPFDNMAWQMFIALNWSRSAVHQAGGLTAPGMRVWQTYRKVSSLFGNSPFYGQCTNALALPVLSIGSDGHGTPMANNDEYFQASTNLPLIDINGNWTLYERRVNDVEAQYLLAPNGNRAQTLTTQTGQQNFIKTNPKGAQFTSSAIVPAGANGSIEIKAAWRIIDVSAGDDPSRYYTQQAIIAVPADLVAGHRRICATATVGLVGMHIIQRNPVNANNPELLPQWIWASFEHVDNAPMAAAPCNVRSACAPSPQDWINQPSCGAAAPSPSVRYSFYNQQGSAAQTNVQPSPSSSSSPSYPWNSQRPYAKGGTTAETAMPQATRCWEIFGTTQQLNYQWQRSLASLKSPFQNYMLIGTQWGGSVETDRGNPLPGNAVPAMLSNMTLETYIQNYTQSTANGGPGSCVGCHAFAALTVPSPSPLPADFSFLPGLAQPATARSKIKTPGAPLIPVRNPRRK
jgi:hypothetical protein